MPRGISHQFLSILDHETRRSWFTLAWVSLALLAGVFLADLADEPRFGDVTLVFMATLVVATLAAAGWGRHAATARTHHMSDHWQQWMRQATGSQSLREVEAKVRGEHLVPPWLVGVAAALAVILNGVVFALLWFEAPSAVAAAFTMAAVNGASVGALLGGTIFHLYWARSACAAVHELVGSGAVAVWGER